MHCLKITEANSSGSGSRVLALLSVVLMKWQSALRDLAQTWLAI
jgi:hypothetical protein